MAVGICEFLADGRISRRRYLYSLNPFGKPPWLLLAQRWNTACQEKGYWRWSARSGEFDAANQLLNRGAKLHGLALAPALVLWPDCGPESETDRPRVA